MGPAAISFILITSASFAQAASAPKIDVPALEGTTNYRCWASLIEATLTIIGVYWTISNHWPTPIEITQGQGDTTV